jgi:hypothetical protein
VVSMPTPGLSLVGFMTSLEATSYLRLACIPPDASDAAILAAWEAAKGRLGAPIRNAGKPNILPIPAEFDDYIHKLLSSQWAAPAFQGPLLGAAFYLVEIEPLLAWQFTVDSVRSDEHCRHLGGPPSNADLLQLCLPLTPERVDFQTFQNSPAPYNQSMMIRSNDLNLRSWGGGMFNGQFMGIQFGVAQPFLHVVRYNGRCYIHNGFHRAVGARRAGATHLPCVLRDVADHESVGIRNDGTTFNIETMESDIPPTVGHFTQDRAYPVSLRRTSRILHVSWAEYVLPLE